jgi:hypothetical protein
MGREVIPNVSSFKYLGVVICSRGSLRVHQQSVSSKARAAAYEVGSLFRRLEIVDLRRLTSYIQTYVDGQFYGLELLPLATANNIDSARKLFMSTVFQLPSKTARNLVYVLFPVRPSLFLMLHRRWKFYTRAQSHDLKEVRDAFLFDQTKLYPNKLSWSFETVQLLKELGVNADHGRLNFTARLEEVCLNLSDVEDVCFIHVQKSHEKTLSFFRTFPSVDVARSFRFFLSGQTQRTQTFLLLFLTCGLRWRFFSNSRRGCECPCCGALYWSWEHFLSCRVVTQDRTRTFLLFAAREQWTEVLHETRTIVSRWCSFFCHDELSDYMRDFLSV